MVNGKMNKCWIWDLGLAEYKKVYDLQLSLVNLRHKKEIEDILLVLEHPPTITLGKFGKPENILASKDSLTRLGIEVCHTNRGGDASFHCPGQLVVYTIMDMRSRNGEVRRFVYDLEQAVIDTSQHFGIHSERLPEHPGVWVEGKQLAAIGLHFVRGISEHGVSFNVNPSLDGFKTINLCGIPGKEATSIANLIGRDITVDEVKEIFIDNLARILNIQTERITNTQTAGVTLG